MPSPYDWSISAGANGSTDTFTMAEGMPPGAVNDGIRTIMARVRQFLNSLGGVAVASGTANNLQIALDLNIASYEDGMVFGFKANTANTGSATASVNGLASKPLKKFISSTLTDLTGNEFRAKGRYLLVFDAAENCLVVLNPGIQIGGLAGQDKVDNDDWDAAGTDLAVANGGTGGSTASAARDNLGVEIGVDVQKFDLALKSVANPTGTIAANTMIYLTGPEGTTSAVTGLTAYARTLLETTGKTTAQTVLGVLIGTDVQAQSPLLEAFSTPSGTRTANRIVYLTGANASAYADLSVYSRGLLAETGAGGWRTGLNLGAVSTDDVVPVTRGGTGGATQAAGRTGLGLGAAAVEDVVPVSKGGTGGATASAGRTGLGLGSLATQSITDIVSQATASSETAFPIGHPIILNANGNGPYNRNAAATPRLDAAGTGYIVGGSGDPLAGTWRSRGIIGDERYLFERMS